MSLKQHLQLLLNRFINKSDAGNLGSMTMSNTVTNQIDAVPDGATWASIDITASNNGFAVVNCLFNVTAIVVRVTGDKHYFHTWPKGSWSAFTIPVVKGTRYTFEVLSSNTGIMRVTFHKNYTF